MLTITQKLPGSLQDSVQESRTTIVAFEMNGVQKDGRSNKHSFLLSSGIFGKVYFEGICFREDFRHRRFGLLQNHSQVRSIAIRVALRRRIQSERCLAASLTTGITFGTAVDAATTTAGRRMHRVDGLAGIVRNLVLGNTVVTRFLDATKRSPTTGEGSCLIAATLASPGGAGARTIHSHEFGLGVEFLH